MTPSNTSNERAYILVLKPQVLEAAADLITKEPDGERLRYFNCQSVESMLIDDCDPDKVVARLQQEIDESGMGVCRLSYDPDEQRILMDARPFGLEVSSLGGSIDAMEMLDSGTRDPIQ